MNLITESISQSPDFIQVTKLGGVLHCVINVLSPAAESSLSAAAPLAAVKAIVVQISEWAQGFLR